MPPRESKADAMLPNRDSGQPVSGAQPSLSIEHESRVLRVTTPIDLGLTMKRLQRGPSDPCTRVMRGQVIRATRTSEGPATILLRAGQSNAAIYADAWGPGAAWAMEHLVELSGAGDDPAPLGQLIDQSDGPGRAVLRDLSRRFAGLRIPRTLAVAETLVPVVLEQKVTSIEAFRSYRELVTAWGEAAPGPPEVVQGLMMPPSAACIASKAYWAFHAFGVEQKRAEILRQVSSYSSRLNALASLPALEAQERMMLLPGIGPWSAAHVALEALGYPDAVILNDFHLPHVVAWTLTGVARSDDATMLQLLEPYHGQRGRVLKLIMASGISAPLRGPRQPIRSFRNY